MRRICLVYAVALFLIAPAMVHAKSANPWDKKLPFKNLTVIYSVSGMETGEEVVYVRNYGKEVATYHTGTTTMMGMSVITKTVDFETPDYVYSYDLQSREGSKSINPKKYMIEEYNKLSKAEKKQVQKNAEKMGPAFSEGMSAKMESKALDILGFSCDKVEIMGGAVSYVIHGTEIPLKTEINMMGMQMSMVATKVNKGRIDGKMFAHPEGITAVTDAEDDSMAKTMALQVMTMLKDPNGPQQAAQNPFHPSMQQGEMTEEEKQMMQQVEQMMQGMMQQ